ncbi:MAG TPA: toll/interleukin-1 receptor domain-containing protein, partial [Pyrinomonadaceae bacterium]
VNEGENLISEPIRVERKPRNTTLREQDVILVEYPERFLKDTAGEVAFIFDRRLVERDVESSQTTSQGKIHIEEKAPPVPEATPDQPYYKAHGEGYSAYANVSIVPSGLTIIAGPDKPEQSIKEAPVSWKWKLQPAKDAGETVSFRFHIDLVWRPESGSPETFSYDWEKTFSVPVGPPPSVLLATYGYRGFGGGGFGLLAIGSIRRRRKRNDELDGDAAPAAEEILDSEGIAGTGPAKVLDLKEQTAAAAAPAKILDEVNTSVYAPRQAAPGDDFVVEVFAHLPSEDKQKLMAKVKRSNPYAKKLIEETLEELIERGSSLTFTLTMKGLDIDEPQQTRPWKGETIHIQFGVSVPAAMQPRDMFGLLVVSHGRLPVGHFRFAFRIVPVGSKQTAAPVSLETVQQYKQAFISYAHEDRAEVLKRVQMLGILRQKFFQDFINLKSGDKFEPKILDYLDKCDVVYLFWSTAASKSEWVKKEVLRAVARHQGQDDAPPKIYPVIIEGPPPAPPPEELNFLHFDDEFAYWIFAAEASAPH